MTGNAVFFAGPYTPHDGHHYSMEDAVPVGKLFGVSPKPQEL